MEVFDLKVIDGYWRFEYFVLNLFDNDILAVASNEYIPGAKMYRFRPSLLRNIERMCRRGGYCFAAKVLEAYNELLVPLLSGEHIMLTTCYPFYYTGHAPKKVCCDRLER